MMAKNENVVTKQTSKLEWQKHTSETVGEAVSFPVKNKREGSAFPYRSHASHRGRKAGRSEIGNLAGDAVSFPKWREAGSLPYSQIAICKIDN